MKQTVANKHTASDVLTANLVKDVWTSVTEGLKADLDSRRETDPGGSAPDPGDSAPDQSHKCADEVSFMPPNVDAMSEATIRKYQDQAHGMIDQSVTLLVETNDGKQWWRCCGLPSICTRVPRQLARQCMAWASMM